MSPNLFGKWQHNACTNEFATEILLSFSPFRVFKIVVVVVIDVPSTRNISPLHFEANYLRLYHVYI